MVEQGTVPPTVNAALYILLLKRLPAPSELLMIASRHLRHALIAIQSGDEYRKQGRGLALAPSARPRVLSDRRRAHSLYLSRGHGLPVGSGTILAGKRNVRRIVLVNGAPDATCMTGRPICS